MDRTFAGELPAGAAAPAGGRKLFRGLGGVNAATTSLVLVLALLGSGCMLRPPRTLTEPPAGDFTGRSEDPGNAAFMDERVPEQVRIAYVSTMGRALPETPLVQDNLLITVVSGGSIVTASASNGRRYWSRRFNGSIAGQPIRVDDRIMFATQHREGSLVALDLKRGRRLWHYEFDARPSSDPAYADGFLYVATDDGMLHSINADRGTDMWNTRIGFLATQGPLVLGDDIIVAARDSLYRVSRAAGTIQARHRIAAAPSAPIVASGDTVFIATQTGTIAAYAERGAREVWRHEVEAPVLAAPVVADDGVYVLTRTAQVWRLNARGAERVAALDGTATESLTVTAEGIIVGLLDGTLTYLRRDGTPVWRELLPGSVRAPAAVHAGAVYVTTLNGRIIKLTS